MTLPASKAGRSAAEPIAVIGLSAIFPGAGDLSAYWAEILSGQDALTDIPATYWSTADYYDPDPKAEDRVYAKRGGFLSPVPFEPLKYGIVPHDLPAIDSTQLLALVAADRALADAGYPAGGPADHRRTAVILGVTGALKMVVSLGSRLAHPQLRRALADSGLDGDVTAEVLKRFANEFTPWVENSFPGLLGNVTAGRICGRLDLGGANLAVDAACASSLAAVRHALLELRSGQADLVITGGADAFNDPFMFTCFSKTPALSPTGEVRPFDQDGDGTMLGEGVGLLVLKRLGEARRDNDRVYAVIREVGASSDGREAAIFAPTVQGQEQALRNTYEAAGIDPGTVELVEGHGTGTNVGDTVEVEALTRVFSQSPRAAAGRPWCALGSVKAQIGHAKAAAGAAGLIKAALALHHKILPPAVKVSRPLAVLNQAASPFHLSARARPWVSSGKQPRRAAVSAFGFGGSNFHCLLEEADPSRPTPKAPSFEFLALAADSPAGLAAALERAEALSPAEAARESRLAWRPAAPARLVLIAEPAAWPARLRLARELLGRPEDQDWPEGLFFGQGPADKTALGLLKPPAAQARPNEALELALAWPEMLKSLGQAQAALAAEAPELGPLGLTLYPPDMASAEYRRVLDNEWADPRPRRAAWRAVAEGLSAVLARFGLKFAVTADLEETGGDLAALLARPENRADSWVALGPVESLPGLQLCPLGEGWPGLAALLGRLAALGFPADFAAWPTAAPAAGPEEAGFSVMISGANLFVKKDLPASGRPSPSGRPADLETPAGKMLRLHQDFLRRQEEILQELRREPAEAAPETPAANPAAPVRQKAEGGSIADLVLDVIARETGYPREMLKPDLNLESDLGLDSIKKVEILSALAEARPDLAGHPAEALSEAVTLKDLMVISAPRPEQARPEPAASAPPPGETTADLIFEVLARETGYPRAMLKPDMNLETDLGLDSIKKVEIISALLEKLADAGWPVPAPEALREAWTLGDLAELLKAGGQPRPKVFFNFERNAAGRPSEPAEAAPRPEPEVSGPPAPNLPQEFKAVRRGPGRPPKNRFPQPSAPGEAEAKVAEQTTAYQVEASPLALAEFRQAARPEGEMILVADESPLAEALADNYARLSGGTVRRFTWRTAGELAEAPENLGSLILVGPEEPESLTSPREAFRILKTAGPALRRAAADGRPSLALGLTFGGGAFGFASVGPASASPAEAALAGLFKTAAREWPEVMVRVVDLPREANLPAARRYLPAILAAAAAQGAPAEMGFLAPDRCVSLRLRPYRLKNIRVRHLKAGQTVLVTGGARGVTAAALRELARSWSPHLVILGRTPLVPAEPEWLLGLTDEAEIRQALWDMAEDKPEPQELARAAARLLAEREVRANLAALEKAGARATYLSGDFDKEDVLKPALEEIKRLHGPIHGFIHGAGVLADSLILEKNESDFDQVFNTKARMARLILEELEGQPLNLAVFFSSSTARFGRRGQADYAAGNEYLNKLALRLSQNRPGPKCLSVNWGPWAGGMVSEPLARLFQEEGVGLISLSEGARLFASLAGTPKHDPVEVVVLGRGTRLEGLAGAEASGARG